MLDATVVSHNLDTIIISVDIFKEKPSIIVVTSDGSKSKPSGIRRFRGYFRAIKNTNGHHMLPFFRKFKINKFKTCSLFADSKGTVLPYRAICFKGSYTLPRYEYTKWITPDMQ